MKMLIISKLGEVSGTQHWMKGWVLDARRGEPALRYSLMAYGRAWDELGSGGTFGRSF